MKYFLLSAFYIILHFNNVFSQTLFGGEIYSSYQGSNKYMVSLILYGSCFDAAPGIATIKAKCLADGKVISSQNVTMPTGIEVSNVCPAQCTRCTKPTCSMIGIKKYTYTALLDISSAGTCCEIIFYYEQGKRTSLITTGPGNTDFYIESYLNRCVNGYENATPIITPEFLAVKNVNYAQALTCYNETYLLDSLSYEFTTPLKPGRAGVTYTGQYSYDKPVYFWGFPNKNLSYPRGIQLDPLTGQLNFRPVNTETVLIAVKVNQFHEGQLYKTYTREWVVNITTQTANNPPVLIIPTSQKICSWSGSNISVSASDADGDSVFFSHHYTIIETNYLSPDKPVQTFLTKPLTDVVKEIYIPVVVRIRDNKCPIPGSSTIVFQLKLVNGVSAIANAADSGCGLFHFFLSDIKGNPDYFLWTGDEEMSSYKSSFYYQYYSPNTEYYYNVLIKNDIGCQFTTSGKIITGKQVREQIFAGVDDTLCYSGEKKILTGSPSGGKWSGKGIEESNGFYYFNPGSPEIIKNAWNPIIYQVMTSGVCLSTDTAKIYILETPKPSAIKPPDQCPTSPAVLLIGSPPGGKWYGNGVSGNQFHPAIGSGTYTLIYEVTTKNICPNYDTTSIFVAPAPNVKFDAIPPNGNIPLTVLFKDSSTIEQGSLEEYLWNFGDGNISTQKGDVIHVFKDPGEYTIILIVTSDKGCISTRIMTNFVSAWKTDIEEHKDYKYHIYQIQENNTFLIYSSTQQKYSLFIYSNNGQLLEQINSEELAGKVFQIPTPARGLLLFRIIEDTGYQEVRKIIFY